MTTTEKHVLAMESVCEIPYKILIASQARNKQLMMVTVINSVTGYPETHFELSLYDNTAGKWQPTGAYCGSLKVALEGYNAI